MELKIRSEIIKNFKTGVIKILVSTDLLSRGIDI
jgi:superfamily II DNA/RNA helicase